MLEVLQFVLSSGWNLFGTSVLILVSGFSAAWVFTGITEAVASKVKK